MGLSKKISGASLTKKLNPEIQRALRALDGFARAHPAIAHRAMRKWLNDSYERTSREKEIARLKRELEALEK